MVLYFMEINLNYKIEVKLSKLIIKMFDKKMIILSLYLY